jgi:uncharacterized surface anchored protein
VITASEAVVAESGTTVKNVVVVTGKDLAENPLPEQTSEAAYSVFENKPNTLTVIDYERGNESILLPGGEFVITDGAGKQVEQGVTDGAGKLVIVGLTDGTYTVKQVKAPDGYLLNDSAYTVTVGNRDISDFVVKVPNEKDPQAPAGDAVKTGSGAQTGRDGLPFWLLASAGIAIAGVVVSVVIYRKKTSKHRR